MKQYCLQYLAAHAANSPSLRVACPICRTDYQITARGSLSAGWRDLLRWSSTDQQLLLRHARFFFLVAPLFVLVFVHSRRAGWSLLLLALAASTAANAVTARARHYAASPLFDASYFTEMYIVPWIRVQPYLVGVGLAGRPGWERGTVPASRSCHAARCFVVAVASSADL